MFQHAVSVQGSCKCSASAMLQLQQVAKWQQVGYLALPYLAFPRKPPVQSSLAGTPMTFVYCFGPHLDTTNPDPTLRSGPLPNGPSICPVRGTHAGQGMLDREHGQ